MAKFSVCRIYKVTLWLNFSYNYSVNLLQILHLYIHPVKTWLPIQSEWRLLFRASRDGFAALAFHFKCDNKGPTITVVKSGGNIFGGFTENAWTSKIN